MCRSMINVSCRGEVIFCVLSYDEAKRNTTPGDNDCLKISFSYCPLLTQGVFSIHFNTVFKSSEKGEDLTERDNASITPVKCHNHLQTFFSEFRQCTQCPWRIALCV